MKQYIFNKNRVCLNPDTEEIKVGEVFASIMIARYDDGIWCFGFIAKGFEIFASVPCGFSSYDNYNRPTKREAREAAWRGCLRDIKDYKERRAIPTLDEYGRPYKASSSILRQYDSVIRQIKEKIIGCRQLELF